MVDHYRGSALIRMVSPMLGVLILMGIFGMVWLRAEIISTEYSIGELESRMDAAMKEKQELEARLSSIMSIQEVGNRELGLGFPDRQKVFFVMRQDSDEPGKTASLKEGRAGRLAEY